MLKQIPNLDPSQLPVEAKNVETLSYRTASRRKDISFCVFKNYLIVLEESHILVGKRKGQYLYSQTPFPLGVARWFVNGIHIAFGKGPNDGGLPVGQFSNEQEIDGEMMYLVRGVAIGGPDMPGYDLVNLSRKKDRITYETFAMGDDVLFDYGLLKMWERLADRYEAGEFKNL